MGKLTIEVFEGEYNGKQGYFCDVKLDDKKVKLKKTLLKCLV